MTGTLLKMLGFLVVATLLGAANIEFLHPKLEWTVSKELKQSEDRYREAVRDTTTDTSTSTDDPTDPILAQAGIDLDRFVELADNGALFIDARRPAEFEAGHYDARFIANFPPGQAYSLLPEIEFLLLEGTPIVIYCQSGECGDSKAVYRLMEELFVGYDLSNVYIYPGGLEGIISAGLPVAEGPPEDLAYVVAMCSAEQQMAAPQPLDDADTDSAAADGATP